MPIPDGVWYPIGSAANIALEFTQGSTILFSMVYKDEAVPRDITTDVFSVYQASTAEFLGALFTVDDPLTGEVTVTIAVELVENLAIGDYWINISDTYIDATVVNSGHIPIRIV